MQKLQLTLWLLERFFCVPPLSVFCNLIIKETNKNKIKDNKAFIKEVERIQNKRVQDGGNVAADQVDTEAVETTEDTASKTQEFL